MPGPTILVVDDQPINVQLLKRKLEREGLSVVTAFNGKEALERVRESKPDLILLDLMMPDMDGIEVCQILQANDETRSIPVIFVTARTAKENKIEGLAVGAVDYITKPLDLDETFARVQTQLRFAAINREVIDLTRRLEEARRAATIGAVTQGIAHNLNNLLGVVIGYLDLLKSNYDRPTEVKKHATHVENAIQRIVVIIRQLSTLVVRSRPPLVKASLQRLLDGSVVRFRSDTKFPASVEILNELGDIDLETNTETFEEVLSKVLANAWESYDEGAPIRPITIRVGYIEKPNVEKMLEIRVEDQGRGIDPELRDRIFEPFISSKHTVGVGMGLTVARHALRNLGGEVTMTERPGGGSIAVLVHPLRKKPKRALFDDV